jgi:hypothetical protein
MKDSFRDRLKRVWSSGTLLLVLFLGVTLLCFVPFGKSFSLLNLTPIIPASVLLFFYLARKSDLSVSSTALGKPLAAPISTRDLARAQDYIDRHYSINAVGYFIELLVALPGYLSRVDEKAQVNGRQINITTKLVFHGKQSLLQADSKTTGDRKEGYPETLLVPLVKARKGLLFDDFKAFGPSGSHLPTLPQWQVYGLIAVALRTLIERAIAGAGGVNVVAGGDALSERDRYVLLQIVRDTAGAIINKSSSDDLSNQLDEFDNRISPEWKKHLKSLFETLIESYLIVVETERQPGDNLLINYSNTIFSERLSCGREHIQRVKHGLLPTGLDIANSRALHAGSYHFEVSATNQELYVYDHHLEELGSSRPLEQEEDFKARKWYVRVYHEEARSVAHLYIRRQGRDSVPDYSIPASQNNYSSDPPIDFKSVIQLREIPPGGFGNAVAIALVTAIMIAYFALFRVGIDPRLDVSNANNNQDIPALMLTLPAFLAAAVGRGMSAERLRNSSLTAFYGLWVIASTSLTAVLLYTYSANRTLPLEITLAVYGGELRLNLIWVALSLFSIGVYLHLRRKMNEEREYYLCLLKKSAIDKQVRGVYNGEVI